MRFAAMTKRMLLPMAAVFAMAFAANGAQSASETSAGVKAAFGNTVMVVDPDGRSRKIWLKPDGSWTGKSRRGLALAGSWTSQGDKVCLSQSKPHLPGSMCETFPSDLGAGVDAKSPMGGSVHIKLVKGHKG